MTVKTGRARCYSGLLAMVALLAGLLSGFVQNAPSAAAQQVAPTGLISLKVMPAYSQANGGPLGDPVDANQPITHYKWLINVDNSGDPTPDPANCLPSTAADSQTPTAGSGNFPAACKYPSVHSVPGDAPVLTSGTEADLSDTQKLRLPNGKYLISVLSGGFKIDGVHFTVNGESTAQPLLVTMNPVPLKTLTVRVNIFNDNAATNGQWDGQAESYKAAADNLITHKEINNMSGFHVRMNDVLGTVTNDVFGNPLCTQYQTDAFGNTLLDADGLPVIKPASDGGATGGQLQGSESLCVSGPDGQVAIPNMGPNRYSVTVIPPDPVTMNEKKWIQTTTLEGGHDWDSWHQEGGTGYDTERIVGGERTPPIDFGFVQIDPTKPNSADSILPATGGGTVKGNISVGRTYVPTIGNANYGFLQGFAGTRIDGPVKDGLVSLACLASCSFAGTDQNVYTGRADANGNFSIDHVPAGSYSLALWDETQNYILHTMQIDVKDAQTTDLGSVPLAGWFTQLKGHVFIDTNGNGRMDPGEQPVPDFAVTVRGRSNYLYDQGQTRSITNDKGEYDLSQVYPLTQFVVIEFYNQRYKTTGLTWQTDNQPTETTMLTSQVDINLLPVIGLSARLDIGIQPYAPGENGGIVGTVSYDTTRNETNPRNAVAEDYQPSIPGVHMQLWAPKRKSDGTYETTATGAVKQFGIGGCERPASEMGLQATPSSSCYPLNTYVSEHWQRTTGCTTRDQNGTPVQYLSMPPNGDPNYDCLEAPLSGVQIGGNGTVDGNYTFASVFLSRDAAGNPVTEAPIPSGDYLVEAVNPVDTMTGPGTLNPGLAARKLYTFTDESAVNVFTGDSYVPQDGVTLQPGTPTPPPQHVNSMKGDPLENPGQAAPAPTARCAGALHEIDDSVNPDFVHKGGSIFNGQKRPWCDVRVVRVIPGRSISPTFFMYTQVPTASRFFGLVINDLGVSTNKKALVYGEAQEIAGMPIGVYDEAGKLKWKTVSDYNGFYEMILPSTSTYSCPLPAGPCPNVYRLIANDPGQPGAPNLDYNPAYRTIGTEFQAWPGVVHPVDQAVTPIGSAIEVPGAKAASLPQCHQSDATPVLYVVDDPIITSQHRTLKITGTDFGASKGNGSVTLDGTAVNVTNWSNTNIAVSIPANFAVGPHALQIVTNAGMTTVGGLTIHVIGGSYQPHIFTVGTGKQFDPAQDTFSAGEPAGGHRAIQKAIEAAHAYPGNAIVVVYPNNDPRYAKFNPDHAYFENIVIHSPLKLQGIGPGGPGVPGSTIDGSSFWSAPAGVIGPNGSFTPGDGSYATDWETFVAGLPRAGDTASPSGEVAFVVAESQLQYATSFKAAIDGFTLTGGNQQGFPNNLNGVGGASNGQARTPAETQGGGVFVNAYVPAFRVTNNVLRSNGGAYGGAIRVGTPDLGTGTNGTSNHNEHIAILNNRIIANGGSNLAGGIGIFNGADGYEIANNDICGNYSTEYGGGISHYGFSPNGKIHDNRIVLNTAYDEGGGIIIAGELPSISTALTKGAGAVDIYNNLIQANLSNDDGGGVRFLMAAGGPKSNVDRGNYAFNVYNNIIANNVATHEGGGVALDDTPNVRFVNNTVVRNLTTATAVTSNGQPAPAGLSTGGNSALLQQHLNTLYGANAPRFSDPVMFNNIFADNRAGTWTISGVRGIGIGGPNDINLWDMGAGDGTGSLKPTNSVINSIAGYTPDPSNKVITSINEVGFASLWDLSVDTSPLRTNPQFKAATIVTVDAPVGQMGNYHLGTPRPATEVAVNLGAPSKTSTIYGQVNAPCFDIDNGPRPVGGAWDIGADELSGTATPACGVVPPVMARVLDNFNRRNATTLSGSALGANWTGTGGILGGFRLTDSPPVGNLPVLNDVTAQLPFFVLGGPTSMTLWRGPNYVMGPNQEAGFTIVTFDGNPAANPNSNNVVWEGLVLKATGNGPRTSFIEVRYSNQLQRVEVRSTADGTNFLLLGTIPAVLNVGDVFRAQALANGTVIVYKGTTQLGSPISVPGFTDGSIGMRFTVPSLSRSVRIDDFRGGNL